MLYIRFNNDFHASNGIFHITLHLFVRWIIKNLKTSKILFGICCQLSIPEKFYIYSINVWIDLFPRRILIEKLCQARLKVIVWILNLCKNKSFNSDWIFRILIKFEIHTTNYFRLFQIVLQCKVYSWHHNRRGSSLDFSLFSMDSYRFSDLIYFWTSNIWFWIIEVTLDWIVPKKVSLKFEWIVAFQSNRKRMSIKNHKYIFNKIKFSHFVN